MNAANNKIETPTTTNNMRLLSTNGGGETISIDEMVCIEEGPPLPQSEHQMLLKKRELTPNSNVFVALGDQNISKMILTKRKTPNQK